MVLKPVGDFAKIFRKKADKAIEQYEKGLLVNMQYVGEQCVAIARTVNTYKDQTGNLRNSIGYVIAKNGKVIRSNFQRTTAVQFDTDGKRKRGNSRKEGQRIGRELAIQLATDHNEWYALVVVAGMNYAHKVESRGLDVLTTAEDYARRVMPQMLKSLQLDLKAIR